MQGHGRDDDHERGDPGERGQGFRRGRPPACWTIRSSDTVIDGPVGTALAAKLPSSGLVGLGYWELGFRQLTNSRHPVTTVGDIEGLKFRVIQSPIYIELFNALGANAVPMPFTELYTALETGAIDGQENPAPSILTAKLDEVQKYMTLTNHTYNPQMVMISGKFWDKLNEEERQFVQQAVLEARDYQRMVSREQAAKAVEELKSEGMEVTELPAEKVSKFREKAKARCGQVFRRDRPRADAAAERPARGTARQELSETRTSLQSYGGRLPRAQAPRWQPAEPRPDVSSQQIEGPDRGG